jgi:hypothetical protein
VIDEGGFARFDGAPTGLELERCFFLDDADRELVSKRRGDHNRLGFALQLGTLRFLGAFLADPTDVPTDVVDYVAAQLNVGDPSCLKHYLTRRSTRFEHAAEIMAVYGYQDFSVVVTELLRWVNDRSWTTGEGPAALTAGAWRWLRDRRVVLPGPSRVERLVVRSRELMAQRLWDTVTALASDTQVVALDALLEVADGGRFSTLEQLRRAPTSSTVTGLLEALDRVAAIKELGFSDVNLRGVPHRRVVELARWGMTGKASLLRRHPPARRTATLLATMVHLQGRAVDDTIALFDLVMTTDIVGKAKRATTAQRVSNYPVVSRDAARCAAAVGVLLGRDLDETIEMRALWELIETVISRADLDIAVANIDRLHLRVDDDGDVAGRVALVGHAHKARRFIAMMCATITFDATAGARPILRAFSGLPALLASTRSNDALEGFIAEHRIIGGVVPAGAWHQLVFPRVPVVTERKWLFRSWRPETTW